MGAESAVVILPEDTPLEGLDAVIARRVKRHLWDGERGWQWDVALEVMCQNEGVKFPLFQTTAVPAGIRVPGGVCLLEEYPDALLPIDFIDLNGRLIDWDKAKELWLEGQEKGERKGKLARDEEIEGRLFKEGHQAIVSICHRFLLKWRVRRQMKGYTDDEKSKVLSCLYYEMELPYHRVKRFYQPQHVEGFHKLCLADIASFKDRVPGTYERARSTMFEQARKNGYDKAVHLIDSLKDEYLAFQKPAWELYKQLFKDEQKAHPKALAACIEFVG